MHYHLIEHQKELADMVVSGEMTSDRIIFQSLYPLLGIR
jgi:hypothetical protein